MVDSGKRRNVRVVHLTASPFYGGPERQMIGLARAMGEPFATTFLCFTEGGKAMPFVQELRKRGLEAVCLRHNYPRMLAAAREVADHLRHLHAAVLLTHGYKSDILGWMAARLTGIPLVVVSRGWTRATRKVCLNEAVDALIHRWANRVVCVSEGQARKVRVRARPDESRLSVIRNSIDMSRFASVDPGAGQVLHDMFPTPVTHVVIAVGRLSPDKGFSNLIEAAAEVCRRCAEVGFLLIGDGPLAPKLMKQIRSHRLQDRFVLSGFRRDVDRLLPHATMLVQSSYREGLPNVVLEAMAAAIPVVATSAGGTPELVVDHETGLIIPPGDPQAIVDGVMSLLGDSILRASMGVAGRKRVEEQFTFRTQVAAYARLIRELAPESAADDYSTDEIAGVQATS